MTASTGMIRCEEALARLWDFLDGELPPDDELAVQKHLEVCSRCYPHYDFQRAYFEFLVRVRGQDQAPPALRRRLFGEILDREARARAHGGRDGPVGETP